MPTDTRRIFLKKIGCAACALPFASIDLFGEAKTRTAKPPNIIFIMADDLGYADLGCYGQKLIKTPHIDQIARDGIRFTQCYAGATVCAPSRSVLMTGMHTGHTTVRGNFGKGGVKGLGGGQGRVPLKKDDVTVAEVLKRAGYVTCMTGKWGLGEPDTSGEPNSQGFDEWFGYLNQRRAHSYYPSYVWHNRERVVLDGNTEGKKTQYTHDLCTEFALDFIKRHHRQPFFLYVPYCIPHARYEVPSLESYADTDWKKDEKAFAAMVTRMDRDVGSITSLLKELGIDRRTIVFFCSDNGAAQRWEGRFDSSGPLRGRKRDLYEGGIRTPMIVSWPGTIEAGKESDAAWSFADVLPTLAALAGEKPPEGIDGVNVLPSLMGKKQKLDGRFLYWEFEKSGFHQAVRWGRWKALRHNFSTEIELYDLSRDIGETNNAASAHPDVVAAILKYLETARTESPHWPAPQKKG